jgi:hypothetical protein
MIGSAMDQICSWFQPALVRNDLFMLFAVKDPNNVLSYRFIQSRVWARGVGCQVSGTEFDPMSRTRS